MSQPDPSPFADRLLQSEPGSDELRSRYELQKRSLTERQMTPLERWMGWLGMPLYAWLIGGTVSRIWTNTEGLAREWLVLYGVSAAALTMLGLWILRALLRGGRVLRLDDRAVEWICNIGLCAFVFALLGVAESLNDLRAAMRLSDCAVVFLLGGVINVVVARMRRARLETQVKLIELELRVAELTRAVAAITPPTSG